MNDALKFAGADKSFGRQLMEALSEYSYEKTQEEKKAVKQVSQEVGKAIKSQANLTFTSRTGDYVKHFAMKKDFETMYNIGYTWHVKDPEYPLTHLLEKGHKIVRNNQTVGHAKEYPHIEQGEKIAQKMLPELIEKIYGEGI